MLAVVEIAVYVILIGLGLLFLGGLIVGVVTVLLPPALQAAFLDPFTYRGDTARFFWGAGGVGVMVLGLLISSDAVMLIGIALFAFILGLTWHVKRKG